MIRLFINNKRQNANISELFHSISIHAALSDSIHCAGHWKKEYASRPVILKE